MTGSRPWAKPEWRTGVESWIAERLAAHGLIVAGPMEQPHIRPWSTVLRVPTNGGDVWFKACAPATAYEAPLVSSLAVWQPEKVLAPLAVDIERGWLLLPDGGPRLREVSVHDESPVRWEQLLTEYAVLQRDVACHADDLLDVGVPDQRPHVMPQHLTRLLGEGNVLTSTEYERLREIEATYVATCAELDAFGIPASIQHNDVHDGNVFVRDGRYIVFDWGDAAVAHPFGSLLATCRNAATRFGLADGAPELARLRDAYLEPWTADYDRSTLVTASRLAMHVAKVDPALAWQRALFGLSPAEYAAEQAAFPDWLTDLLDTVPP